MMDDPEHPFHKTGIEIDFSQRHLYRHWNTDCYSLSVVFLSTAITIWVWMEKFVLAELQQHLIYFWHQLSFFNWTEYKSLPYFRNCLKEWQLNLYNISEGVSSTCNRTSGLQFTSKATYSFLHFLTICFSAKISKLYKVGEEWRLQIWKLENRKTPAFFFFNIYFMCLFHFFPAFHNGTMTVRSESRIRQSGAGAAWADWAALFHSFLFSTHLPLMSFD